MNWKNVNLKSPYERSQNLLEPYTFDILLLEISCNLKEINRDTVKAQALESINAKYREALSILNCNLDNITSKAKAERNIQ